MKKNMKDTKQYLGHMLLSIPKDITAVSLTVNFSCSIVLMCLIVSSGLRFSNSVNTLNNVLTFLTLKGKVIIKNWACPAFDPVVHITEDYKNTTRPSKIFLHENNNKTIFSLLSKRTFILLVCTGTINSVLVLL
jgi:hypothetical protein